MQIKVEKITNECNKSYIYFAHPWTDYVDQKIWDYLQNSRHLIEPEVYKILDTDLLVSIIDEMDDDITNKVFCCFSHLEDIPNVEWVTSFEKKTECVQFGDRNTIVLDFAQICNIVQVILDCQLANEDMLAKYELIRNECAKIMGEEIAYSEAYDQAVNDLIDLEELSDFEITYSIVNRNISDILFCKGHLDGAFHYCSRAVAFKHLKKDPCYVRKDSIFSNINNIEILKMVLFRETGLFLAAHEAHHIELRRELDALAWHDRKQIPMGLFKRLFDWFVMCKGEFLNDLWHRFGRNPEKRGRKIVEDLYEAFSNNQKGCNIIDVFKESILAWGKVDYDFDIMKMTDSEYAEFIEIISECYCDIMALYNLMNVKNAESFRDVCSNITTIIRILIIQETNKIVDELIGYMYGKNDQINSLGIFRIQLFCIAIINEITSKQSEFIQKFNLHYDINWNDPSRSFSEVDSWEPLMLGIFKFPATHEDYADFIEEMQGIIDEMHEYYYKSMIYEIFHVYEHGFICDECNSVYIKSEGIKIAVGDYETGVLVTNIPSIMLNENIVDAKKAGEYYLNRDKKVDVDGNCIIDTAPLSKIARIVRCNQLVDLFRVVRTEVPKELFDNIKMVKRYENGENTYNE